jgi:hypothetical protein
MNLDSFLHVLGWLGFAIGTPTGLVFAICPSLISKKFDDPERQWKIDKQTRLLGVFMILSGIGAIL